MNCGPDISTILWVISDMPEACAPNRSNSFDFGCAYGGT